MTFVEFIPARPGTSVSVAPVPPLFCTINSDDVPEPVRLVISTFWFVTAILQSILSFNTSELVGADSVFQTCVRLVENPMLVDSAVMKVALVAIAVKKATFVESAVTSAEFVDRAPASELMKYVFASSPFITFVSAKNNCAVSNFNSPLQKAEVVGILQCASIICPRNVVRLSARGKTQRYKAGEYEVFFHFLLRNDRAIPA
jgi:hypothetical protein